MQQTQVSPAVDSQFPLWDFFDAKLTAEAISQFPLWDFFECNNFKDNSLCGISLNAIEKHPRISLSIPFVGFL
jgi:hypothetical protein